MTSKTKIVEEVAVTQGQDAAQLSSPLHLLDPETLSRLNQRMPRAVFQMLMGVLLVMEYQVLIEYWRPAMALFYLGVVSTVVAVLFLSRNVEPIKKLYIVGCGFQVSALVVGIYTKNPDAGLTIAIFGQVFIAAAARKRVAVACAVFVPFLIGVLSHQLEIYSDERGYGLTVITSLICYTITQSFWFFGNSIKTAQLKLEQSLINLKESVDELALRRQKQAQLFSIIGHELRTPLSSMKMMEEAMGLRNIGEYGANICESTDVVLNIIDDLRTVINPDKAYQAQVVVDSPFDVLSRTTRSLEGLYEEQGVDVVVSSNQLSHSQCKFNAQALRQKITNLTKNAAIHADADTVWVDLQAQSRGDGQIDLTLTVEDNGKGIPEGLREAVFGAFSRGDTRADGTGLGLYITRELAQKLDGTVEYFESSKGGAGFKVEFTLDLHLDTEVQEVVEEAIPVALQGKRILFAEDQKTLQLLTSKLLKDAGAEVVVCDNGKQALEAFRAGEFDIVLTDLMMPEMTGDELIRYIRADGFTGQVVALTAAIIGKETETLLEAGADAVLNKPLDIYEMKRTVAVLENKEVCA